MSRKHGSKYRSTKHRQNALESNSNINRHIVKDSPHNRSRRDHSNTKKRSAPDPAGQSRPCKHNSRRRHKLEADTDGDFAILPTPPPSPMSAPRVHEPYKQDDNGFGARRHHVSEHLPRPLKCARHRQEPYGESAIKNYRFRHQFLSLIDQQRDIIETWADSVGAGGSAEPMDWQPEQERIVYFARLPMEDQCYTDRWRIDESKETTRVVPALGSWASQRWLDGSMMWSGSPTVGVGLVEDIE